MSGAHYRWISKRSNKQRSSLIISALIVAVASTGHSEEQRAPFESLEPSGIEQYTLFADTPQYRTMLERGLAERESGDIDAALEHFSWAADRGMLHANFELWDDIAELYCERAARTDDVRDRSAWRSSGKHYLAEFKCAQSVVNGARCWVSQDTNFPGAPNPDLSPLCFAALCSSGINFDRYWWDTYLDAGEGEHPFHWLDRDAKNITAIERRCEK